MATDDLFTWLDAIWDKRKPEGTFPAFVAHRFLASDRKLALPARVLGNEIRDPAMLFATWQALEPEESGAPKLIYPAAKKRPEAEELTRRMMTVLSVRRQVAEEMQVIVGLAGKLNLLYDEYGVKRPDDDSPETEYERPKKGKKKSSEPVGLMAQVLKL